MELRMVLPDEDTVDMVNIGWEGMEVTVTMPGDDTIVVPGPACKF